MYVYICVRSYIPDEYRRIDTRINKQTNKQTNRQTSKQTNKHTYIIILHTYIYSIYVYTLHINIYIYTQTYICIYHFDVFVYISIYIYIHTYRCMRICSTPTLEELPWGPSGSHQNGGRSQGGISQVISQTLGFDGMERLGGGCSWARHVYDTYKYLYT